MLTEESLKSKMGNRIDFVNAILKNEKTIKGEPGVYYCLKKYKRYGFLLYSDRHNLNYPLFNLMDYLVNANHFYQCCWVLDI